MLDWSNEDLMENLGMNEKEIETFRTFTTEADAKVWLEKRLKAFKSGINRICPRCGTYCYGDCASR